MREEEEEGSREGDACRVLLHPVRLSPYARKPLESAQSFDLQ